MRNMLFGQRHILGNAAAHADDFDDLVAFARRDLGNGRGSRLGDQCIQIGVTNMPAFLRADLCQINPERLRPRADGWAGERLTTGEGHFDFRRAGFGRGDEVGGGCLVVAPAEAGARLEFGTAVDFSARPRKGPRLRGGDTIAIPLNFNHHQGRSNRDHVADRTCNLQHRSRHRRFHFDCRLVGHHVRQALILLNPVADLDMPSDNLRLSNAFADIGQTEFKARHCCLHDRRPELVSGPMPRCL